MKLQRFLTTLVLVATAALAGTAEAHGVTETVKL